MKIKQEAHEERGQIDKKGKFSRFKEMVERNSRVALAAFAVTFAVSCGDDTTGRDGGNQDGGTTDSGTQDSGPDPDGGNPTSLCTQYGPGDAHRAVFLRDETATPTGGTHWFKFKSIVGTGDGRVGTFNFYSTDYSTNESVGFTVGQRKNINIAGIGFVSFELCEMTANECSYSGGDPNCSATLASTNTW